MNRLLIFIVLFFSISCSPDKQEKYENTFDIPLLARNEKIWLSGDYQSVLRLNEQYLKMADQKGYDDGKALCYIHIAQMNMALQQYEKALFFYSKAEGILKNSKNSAHKALFFSSYGYFNHKQNHNNGALECNNKALEYINKDKKTKLGIYILPEMYIRRAFYFQRLGRNACALKCFYKARLVKQSTELDLLIGEHHLYRGKRLDSAAFYILKGYNSTSEERRSNAVSLYANAIVGEYCTAAKQYHKAEYFLTKALKIDKITKKTFRGYTRYIYNDFASLYKKTGNKEKALFYLKAYAEGNDTSHSALLKAIEVTSEKLIANENSDLKAYKRKVIISIGLLLFLISFLGIYIWKTVKKLNLQKKNLSLEAENFQNQTPDTKLEEVIELVKKNDPSFLTKFKEVYPEFIASLLRMKPNLEDSELALCAMIKLHFSSKEIAAYTLVQHRSVQQRKYRLKKKLNIPGEEDLYRIINELDP